MSAAEKPQNDSPLSISRAWIIIFSASALTGLLAFLWGITGPAALRAWQAYLINFVYWTGLSCGAVLFVAVLNMTNAVWGRPLKRLAEALGTFLPASFILFWVLYFGKEEIFPWIKDPLPEKQSWLNPGFLFARDGVGLFLLTAFSLTLIYYSVKGDKQALRLATEAPEKVSTQEARGRFLLEGAAGSFSRHRHPVRLCPQPLGLRSDHVP